MASDNTPKDSASICARSAAFISGQLRDQRQSAAGLQNLLEQQVEVGVVVVAVDALNAALQRLDRALAHPEREQRADHKAERAAHGRPQDEEDIARVL